MALQIRRGDYGDFDKSRMLPGEPAAVLANDPETPSGKAFYVCYEAGDVKRLIAVEDIEEMVARGDFKGEKGDKGDTGKDGTSVTGADINDSGHLILTMSDRTQIDAGFIDDALAKIEEATRAATSASESATAAEQSEKSAGQHNTDAETWAKTAQSYATGDSGSREGEELDNAKEYARQAKASADRASEAAGGDFVTHAEVGETVAPLDETRKVPAEYIPESVGKVQGVKGEAEEGFRDGNVIIKKSDIGLGNVENKSPADIIGGMMKGDVTKALGYEPPKSDEVLMKGEVDGRNLFIMKDSELGYLSDDSSGTVSKDRGMGEYTSDYIPVSPEEILTIRTQGTTSATQKRRIAYLWFEDKKPESHIGFYTYAFKDIDGYGEFVVTTSKAPDNAKYIRIDARLYSDGRIKVERGSVATDWTPAPEDVVTTETKLFQKYDTTLTTTGWQNDAAPFTYEIPVTGLTATQLVIVNSGGNLTKAQLEAYAEAVVDKYDQQAGKVILQALNKPSTELPVSLLIGGEVGDYT